MGRSTSTTKGGKFMNPTDQARKEQRKRELKKNKKQRVQVRTAVLKGQDPREIIENLEKIDDMEYNPVTPCPHAPKVMFEKRRKLAETWDRVIKMYEKEQPDKYSGLKQLWNNYSARKIEVVKYYESVINAHEVEVDSIPLPSADDIPLPPPSLHLPTGPPKSVLKKPGSVLADQAGRAGPVCPGVPAGPPPPIHHYNQETPDLQQEESPARKRTIRFEEDEEDDEAGAAPPGSDRAVEQLGSSGPAAQPGQPNPLQKKMLAMAGQDLDQFMREMEEVHRTREAEKAADLQERLARLEGEAGEAGGEAGEFLVPAAPPAALPPGYQQPVRPGVPPPGIRPPPGPPPGRPPIRPSSLLNSAPTYRPGAPGQAPPGVRPPPGPPPGVPPRAARPALTPHMPRPLVPVVTAKPQLNRTEVKTDKVISGAPVMRNLRSDVTRFVPTNLRVRREEKERPSARRPPHQPPPASNPFGVPAGPAVHLHRPAPPAKQAGKSKDDAYADFMKEMQGLL